MNKKLLRMLVIACSNDFLGQAHAGLQWITNAFVYKSGRLA